MPLHQKGVPMDDDKKKSCYFQKENISGLWFLKWLMRRTK